MFSSRWRTMVRPMVAAVAALVAFGCSDSQAPGTTQFSVKLKDAPANNIKAAVVTIDQVQLVGQGGVHTLTTTPTTVDLLTLANTTADLVKDVVVPSGLYTELRFVISGAYVEVDNGDGTSSIYASSPDYAGLPDGATVAGQLQMPSFAQSGLKVTLESGALSLTSDQKIVVVDFDVQQSFGQLAGQSGMWVLHPVITGGDIQTTGSVHTTVQLAEGVTLPAGATLADFSATLTNTTTLTSTTVALTDADADGVFDADFAYVAPGDYEVSLVLPATVTAVTTTPAIPVAVSVASGQSASAALTVTAAN